MVMALLQFRHPLCVDIEAERWELLAERGGQGQANVAKTDHGDTDLVLGRQGRLHADIALSLIHI